jgi:hypothetical protein
MMLTIDPGVHRFGAAMFGNNKRLVAATWVTRDDMPAARDIEHVITEMPRIYPGSGQQKGDLNDLLDLAASVGYVEGLYRGFAVCERVFPGAWKGQVPKKIMTARILAKLSPEELACIERVGAKDHNTIDAVGIGLWKLGRLR